jgi:hypothetical protein
MSCNETAYYRHVYLLKTSDVKCRLKAKSSSASQNVYKSVPLIPKHNFVSLLVIFSTLFPDLWANLNLSMK